MVDKSKKRWPQMLLGWIFLAIGLTVGAFVAGSMIVGFVNSRDWIEVPATIHNVNLETSQGDSTTYSVSGSYSYRFNDIEYHGDRMSLSSGHDNFGSYWQDLASNLTKDQQGNEASVFVNPSDPTQSVMDRTFRWGSVLFGGIFLFVFGGIGAIALLTSKKESKLFQPRNIRTHKNGINSDQKSSGWLLLVFGGVFFSIGLVQAINILPSELADKNYRALFVIVFTVIGAGIIFFALKQLLSYFRFGPTQLFLDPEQPGVGGHLGGEISLSPKGLSYNEISATKLKATLTCSRKTNNSYDSDDTTHSETVWQDEVLVNLVRKSSGLFAQFLFEIPESCEPTTDFTVNSAIAWSVQVNGFFKSAKRIKFSRSWPVTVTRAPAYAKYLS